MVEFDVIMGVELLASCHANVDCRSKIVRFQFPGEPVLEWKEAENAYHLCTMLKVLQEGKLYAKFSKCEFWLNSVAFLGHVISGEGIRVDTQKIEVVKTWPRPTTPMEVHSFLGLVAYYRRFVEGFSSHSTPLTKLTQKGAMFQWTDACKQSFQALKYILTSAPVLTLPEGTNGYVIYCDASVIGLGYVLMQHGDIGINIQDTATSSLVTKVKECQYEDHVLVHYSDITLQKEKTPFDITKEGVLRYQGRLCVPNVAGLRQQIMGETHYSHYSIHLGATKIYHDIREVYWWDGIKKDIVEFVAQCSNCQHVKIEHQKPGGYCKL
ncbi:uncharacterized protein [Nicotiana sylvestris]|uniref:uncharacterized protein n=1 Tax=Nicotiana sylvestris TaxID=4096 RepID=UPI00388C7E02